MRVILAQTILFPSIFFIGPYSFESWSYFGVKHHVRQRVGRFFKRLPEETLFGREMLALAEEYRLSFVEWLDQQSERYRADLDWIFSFPAVKNIDMSFLYNNLLTYLLLEREIAAGKKIDLVIVDSFALAKLIAKRHKMLGRFYLDNFWGISRWFLLKVLRWIYMYVRNAIEFIVKKVVISQLLAGNAQKILKEQSSKGVFIRSYISGEIKRVEDSLLEKHFFPGLYDYLVKHDRRPVFLSLMIPYRPLNAAIAFIKNSARPIMLPEELLGWKDYGRAFISPFRGLLKRRRYSLFQSLSIDSLVNEDYVWELSNYGVMQAQLLCGFGNGLAKAGSNISEMINWTENQGIEKALILGLRRARPDFKIIASQPFVYAKDHLSFFYSEQDRRLNILPDRLLVLGPVWAKNAQMYVEQPSVRYSPAFRYQHVFSPPKVQQGKVRLLIALGYELADAIYTAGCLSKILPDILEQFDEVLIKPHPFGNYSVNSLFKMSGVEKLPAGLKIVEDPLKDILPDVSYFLASTTGAVFEAIAFSIPVVMVSMPNKIAVDYTMYNEGFDLWKLCFTSNEIRDALKHYRRLDCGADQVQQKIKGFMDDFFTPQTDELWANYLLN